MVKECVSIRIALLEISDLHRIRFMAIALSPRASQKFGKLRESVTGWSVQERNHDPVKIASYMQCV